MNRLAWILPLLILIGGTLLFRYSDLDLIAAKAAYDPNGAFTPTKGGFWGFIYTVAAWPAIGLALWSILHLLASWRWSWLRRYNRAAWCFLAALVIGPGLIVNVGLKDHFGRPRPRQVESFGGNYSFQPVLTPGVHEDARSFASGHASIAFFLITPFFFAGRNRRLALSFLLVGLSWGTLVGTCRVLQGGHWPSDVLWAAGIVYFTGFFLNLAFGFRPSKWRDTR